MKVVKHLTVEEYSLLKDSIKKEVGISLIDVDMEDNKIYHHKDGNISYPIKVASRPIGREGSVITMNFNIATLKEEKTS
jgi:hypothetical protein